MKFENLSDGKSDGFALFYFKDGTLNTVALTSDQATALDLMLKVAFGDSKVHVTPADKSVILPMLKGGKTD